MIAQFYTFLRKLGRFFKTIYRHFFEDRCTIRAAALTYTTLLSLVPLMTVSFAIFSAFPVFENVSEKIKTSIFDHFIAASGTVIQNYLNTFIAQTKHLSAIGSIFLVVTAVLMMFNMEQAFNAIWRVKARRRGLATFMMYWAVLTLSPILIGLSIVLSNYLANLPIVVEAASIFGLDKLFTYFFPYLLITFAFTIFYVAIPNCYVPLKFGFFGAVIAAILFELAKTGFGYYVSHFPTYTLLYGTLAVIPLFLIWLYLTWVIILFGAIISHVLATGHYFRSAVKIDGFTHAYRWLHYLYQAQHKSKALSLSELIHLDKTDYQISPAEQIQAMLDAKLIIAARQGRYLLTRDLNELSLKNFIDLLPWRLPNHKELKRYNTPHEKKLAEVVYRIESHCQQELNLKMIELVK
ncbi:MAG: YihY family inner membrane protein [Pseudomonadota bacterium]